ncbi:MAG TPA: DUF1549 domain-containing protein, partial [Gemmataceae bacterium]|nr:DUF1549 domain-containing protein [Gemmataceae bacterium]
KKSDDAEAKEPKKAELPPPPSTFPARKDFVDPSQGGVQHVTFIDDQIKKVWKENKTYPSDRCSDHEFLRRASLDIIGRIPTLAEIGKFMSQPEEKRRSWVINEMLDGPSYGYGKEYAQNFANIWTVYLMTRSGSSKHHQAQMNDWLYDQFKGDKEKEIAPDWSKTATQLIAASGKTNEKQAVNYLLHNMGEDFKQDPAKNGKWDMIPATSRTTRLFLGIRTQCVQCHDHPFNGEWRQEHFWGINAFFRQIDTTPGGRPNPMLAKKKKGEKIVTEYTLSDNNSMNSRGLVPYERRNAVLLFTDPSFLDGKKIPKNFKGTRREALAGFVTTSPFFSKAFVNRTWNHFFGKSFTRDAVDDFHEQNQISHPELLEKLATDWASDYKHNPKVLIRWICNSQAYGLSSRANKWNDQPDHEVLFARMLLKPMTPEQMFESMMIATQARISQNKDDKLAAKEAWLNKLVVNFGNDEGEEGSFSGTVVQALLLMNGQDINNAITDKKEGTVAAIVQKRGASYASLKMAVRDMYLATVNREPTAKEIADYSSPNFFSFRPGSKTSPNSPEFWRNYYEDIMWALLNSNEFILNH